MLRTKIQKKGLRSKKMKTKFNTDVSFTKSNSIDKTMLENETTKATLSLNGYPDASSLSDNNIKLTVIGSNARRDNVNSVTSTCSSTPRGMTLLNQTTLYDVPCHQINMTDATIIDTDKQNNSAITPTVPLSHDNGSDNGRAFGNSSPQGGIFVSQQQQLQLQLYFQSGEQLQKLFQQQQLLVIEHLQRQIKQGKLNAKKHNEATSSCHRQHLGSCNIATNDANDVELDLDTIFDDNGNDFNNNHKNAYNNYSSTRNGSLLTSRLGTKFQGLEDDQEEDICFA